MEQAAAQEGQGRGRVEKGREGKAQQWEEGGKRREEDRLWVICTARRCQRLSEQMQVSSGLVDCWSKALARASCRWDEEGGRGVGAPLPVPLPFPHPPISSAILFAPFHAHARNSALRVPFTGRALSLSHEARRARHPLLLSGAAPACEEWPQDS